MTSPRILIVEDELIARENLDHVLKKEGAMQVKLLRVLQERTLLRVGGTNEIPVDLRILAATNKDLKKEVEQGTFRQDLYYRLNVVTLVVPPLAARPDDIPLLVQHFLEKFSRAQGQDIREVDPEVMDLLMHYQYPGNVRELENLMERAVTLCRGQVIEVQHLPPDLQNHRFQVQRRTRRNLPTLEETEREYILWVMEQVQGNKTRAAEVLGIDRVSLWRKLKRYGLDQAK